MVFRRRATKHGATYFNILAPGQNEEAMFNGSTSGNQFEGVLPASGDCKIRVYMMREGNGNGIVTLTKPDAGRWRCPYGLSGSVKRLS